MFKREWDSTVTAAKFNVRAVDRRPRTSWIVPPAGAASELALHQEASLRETPVPAIDLGADERASEVRPVAEPVPPPPPAHSQPSHPPTIHAAFVVNGHVARMNDLLERLAASIELLATERARIAKRAEPQLVQLAGAIARRVLGREVALDPALLADLAAEGLQVLGEKEKLVVRIGPLDDAAAVENIRARLAARAPHAKLVVDPALEPGGCVVEGEHGSVDESLEERLGHVMKALSAIEPTDPSAE
ncbi:MAG TPA: FliH/SctL family protein [Polyangiaceae bacterium]|nr:FliH/SctL family protein [Polyangiaceae bacterium]